MNYSLNHVRDFDPYQNLEEMSYQDSNMPVIDRATGETKKTIRIDALLTWFWKKYPDGSIVTEEISDTSEFTTFRALVYADRRDTLPIATGSSKKYHIEGEEYPAHDTAETLAVRSALRFAGFGPEIYSEINRRPVTSVKPGTVKSDDAVLANLVSIVYDGYCPSVKVSGLDCYDFDYYTNDWKCGKATVIIYGTGNYKGTITKSFIIKPAKSKISSVTTSNKTMKVKIKSQKKLGVTGYQIYYKKAGGSAKKITTTSTIKSIKGLTTGKKYTVKVRAYKTINGKKVYGKYSKAKTVKIKPLDTAIYLEDFSWRNRYKTITLKVYNDGSKTITYYSKGAKYIDYDTSNCDRDLEIVGHDSVSIKSGQTKTIKLKVTNGSFWWSPYGSKVMMKSKYDGIKYNFYFTLD